MERQRPRGICYSFRDTGSCKYGPRCRYTHAGARSLPATTDRNSINTSEPGTTSEAPSAQSRLRTWRYLIPTGNRRDLLGTQLTGFLQEALALISDDTSIMQDVVIKLTSEGGLLRVKELIDYDFASLSESQGLRKFEEQILPFCEIIAHDSVISSMTLEKYVGTVYNFIYGMQGERAVNLFTFLVKLFAASEEHPEQLSLENLETVLAVFSRTTEWNGQAVINTSLVAIAESLVDIVQRYDPAKAYHARRLLTSVGRRLSIGRTLLEVEEPAVKAHAKAAFTVTCDLPGIRSAAGPRHDNDHAEIHKIKILPTHQEITSIRPDYLPPRSQSGVHDSGADNLIDRHFRLLREDTVGQLRDTVRAELDRKSGISNAKSSGLRTYVYHNLAVIDVSFSRWRGLECTVRIDQPNHIRSLPSDARADWWESCTNLQTDALVCIIGSQNQVLFCTVSDPAGPLSDQDAVDPKSNSRRNMGKDVKSCYVKLSLIEPSVENITIVFEDLSQIAQGHSHRLAEFPGVLLPSFKPTLEALQKMSIRHDLPFAELIAAGEQSAPASDILPPVYATKDGFSFPLRDVLRNTHVNMSFSLGREFDRVSFRRDTFLDEAQADALLDCLSRSMALVQGPPGTGKSYTGVALIKILLSVKKQAQLGPIVCVCYTNHALDQLLEHLLDHGVDQIIRIGSRSKSERLDACNLRKVARDVTATGLEKRERWESLQLIEGEETEITNILKSLSEISAPSMIKQYLERHHQHHYMQLYTEESAEGWEIVRNSKSDEVQEWLSMRRLDRAATVVPRPLPVLKNARLFRMSAAERQTLYQHWLKHSQEILVDQLKTAMNEHERLRKRGDDIHNDQNLRCLEKANIIGVTTTGLARQLDLLRRLKSKVLICEEAGEVLEAHILTALLPSLEHVIMIGDHQQLPPHIQNYDLSRENPHGQQYSLDVSLFERLVQPVSSDKPGLPFSILQTQRRMHPSISELIRVTLYPALQDSPTVSEYPEVDGMKKRLFWLDHHEPETGTGIEQLASTSHTNQYEIRMVVALVTHLVRQGVYQANDIAVLTPYLGQLLKIRNVLKTSFEITMSEGDINDIELQGIEEGTGSATDRRTSKLAKTSLLKALKVSTIDNFQGEEAKVVIISLVRSNDMNKCGFLRTSNRINVLLSRAQHGMYIIGNSSTSGHVGMWAQVLQTLQRDGNFGDKLELECPRHPTTAIKVSNPDDFLIFSPEGGCGLLCDRRLHCGHSCINKCHSEILHTAVKCLEDCPRPLEGCPHACPRRCGENCVERCMETIKDITVTLPCGHQKHNLPCWQVQHPEKVRCTSMMKRKIPGCGHEIELECYVEYSDDAFDCNHVCDARLVCGHSCRKPCFRCRSREKGVVVLENHGKCNTACEQPHNSCSHRCGMRCHEGDPCPPCDKPCEVSCGHSKCPKKCHEPCAPCAEDTCFSSCPHSTCTMPCAAPCNWLPCSKRCLRILECGHQCPTVCGERCPPKMYCQVCANDEVKNAVVDFIMMSSYAEIDLDEDPCIIPSCGHLYTVSSMDGQMDMSQHYSMEGTLAKTIVDPSRSFSMEELKSCATCRGSLRDIARYGRIVRRALIDESTKRFIKWSQEQMIALTEALHDQEKSLATSVSSFNDYHEQDIILNGTFKEQVETMNLTTRLRYKKMIQIRNRILDHLGNVDVNEQPYKRVWDLVNAAKRKRPEVDGLDLDPDVLQTSESVKANALVFRCELVILADFLKIKNKAKVKLDLQDNRRRGREFIAAAKGAHQPKHIVEGHLFIAQLCAAERSNTSIEKIDAIVEEGKNHVAQAWTVCAQSPGSTRLIQRNLKEVETMLRESTFYSRVRDDELIAVMAAMREEFRGTGHWYTCENNHPFTIGECGMPMELAKCPQCGAAIGGQGHRPAAGVRHAEDFERRFGQMNLG